ncbi:MAG: hypothetical protein M0R46_15875 [Candidatus Muirbacterium halophilum]|nr:hypothetical protein [Candidatus Muirbacterium halophilum]MCK9477395.1 hypothetical protein [Candidatus Muirbacterium halophilum]
MAKLSSIFIITMLCFFLTGCNEKKSEHTSEIEKKLPIKTSINLINKKTILPHDEFVINPLKMYIRNKELVAQAELKNTYSRNSKRDDSSTIEQRKIEDIRDNFISNKYEIAYQKGKDLLANPNTTPQIKAEIYFMFANMTKEYSADDESLDYIGKAYEALKEIHNMPEITQKVNSFTTLNQNINEINDFTPEEEDL